jgi:hypothetical protein
MCSDQQVSSRIILQTIVELKRQGATAALAHLEQVEPDLAEYVMESLTDVHYQILALGATTRRSRRVYRRVESLVLISIAALRKGHYELWARTTGSLGDSPPTGDGSSPPPMPLPPDGRS